MDLLFDHAEYGHYRDRPSVKSFAGQFPDASDSTGGEISSQDTACGNHGVFPATSHLSPSHTASLLPSTHPYNVGFHLSSTIPVETACLPSHLGDSRRPPNVVENRCFDSREWPYQVSFLTRLHLAECFPKLHECRGSPI